MLRDDEGMAAAFSAFGVDLLKLQWFNSDSDNIEGFIPWWQVEAMPTRQELPPQPEVKMEEYEDYYGYSNADIMGEQDWLEDIKRDDEEWEEEPPPAKKRKKLKKKQQSSSVSNATKNKKKPSKNGVEKKPIRRVEHQSKFVTCASCGSELSKKVGFIFGRIHFVKRRSFKIYAEGVFRVLLFLQRVKSPLPFPLVLQSNISDAS